MDAEALHREALVIDAAAPLPCDRGCIDNYIAGGVDILVSPVADNAAVVAEYDERLSEGRWRRADHPPPPYHYPDGIEMPEKLSNLTAALAQRGFSGADSRAVVGGNWMRVLDACWGA